MIYGTICSGPQCTLGANRHAVPRGGRGMPPSPGPRRAHLSPGLGAGGTGAVPAGAAGTRGAASSSHGVVGAGAEIPLRWVQINHISGGAK